MKIRNDIITRIEFVGGPEDGRILELSDCPAMVTAEEAEEIGKVSMFLAMDNLESFEEGDELELIILGHYVSSSSDGSCAKFDWVPFC
ncbi:hypothetical protein OKA05_10960 [Luteolibacter arcticus]|uniref:Uncharacterized protein n=1 Tax=Luteolibacter arcticus TaxID=1581411 RepID=A0ABT3GHT5_9BACT|nr:hypothetical protein [Luteolibacter arcticus]MCW1923073.1 hypothetical protein [Luteolibacter arcticus]